MNKIKQLICIIFLTGIYWTANAAGTVRIVTSNADSGEGTLRAAIAALAGNGQASAVVDTIRFDPKLRGDTIVLTTTGTTGTALYINSKNVFIDGEDNHIVLSGNNALRLFQINNSYSFNIYNLTLTKGYSNASTGGGGAITCSGRSGGTFRFTNVQFENNTNSGSNSSSGGAIRVSNGGFRLIIDQSTFTGNKLVYTSTTSGIAYNANGGGAIFSANTATIEISNSLFENNSAPGGNGGAILGRILTVTGCVFKNNSAGGYGGAIALDLDIMGGTTNNSAKFLANTFIGNRSSGTTIEDVFYGGGVFGTTHTSGSAVFAGNIFQDNTTENSTDYNEFYHSNTAVTITSGGYNVFKGASVPSGTDVWTSVASDLADADDIVDAEKGGRITLESPAFGIIDTDDALITGLAWPATDMFGNASGKPYNAGADQGDGVLPLEDIAADLPLVYEHNVEKDLGTVRVGQPALTLSDVGFSLPSGLAFTDASAALKSGGGGVFTLSGVSVTDGANGAGTHLSVTVNFAPVAEQEYVDTLVIGAAGANDFVIPLRGTGIAWEVSPATLQNFAKVAVGKTSEAQTLTISGSSVSGAFSYSLKNERTGVFPVTEVEGYAAGTGGSLEIRFAPAAPGLTYRDTLVIVSAGSAREYEIALEGGSEPVAASPTSLSFDGVVVDTDQTLDLAVTIAESHGVEIKTITIGGDDAAAFAFEKSDDWSDIEVGGTLSVTFTPSAARVYTATLTLGGENFADIEIALTGTGLARPVIGSDVEAVDFGRAAIGETKTETVTVTLTHPQAPLTAADITLAVGRFGLSTGGIGTTTEGNEAEVTLSFTPSEAGEYLDTLVVVSAYAEELRIPLSGEGYRPVVTSDVEAVDFGEVVAGETLTETVTVTLTDPFAPLTDAAFTLAQLQGSFAIVSVVSNSAASSATADAVDVTLSFTPAEAVEYLDTLVVRADYAEEYRIPLAGTGTSDVGISVTGTTAPYLSVRNGDIVLKQASAGSLAGVYNLQGRLLITRTVSSDEEILKTGSLPRGVYIVALRNAQGEILKAKVVL